MVCGKNKTLKKACAFEGKGEKKMAKDTKNMTKLEYEIYLDECSLDAYRKYKERTSTPEGMAAEMLRWDFASSQAALHSGAIAAGQRRVAARLNYKPYKG
ncbi:MAG: hypothetical protein WC438_01700 [Candidatus Pacearchaeota archaeon]